MPAVGYAAGIERLFIALEAAGTALPEAPPPDVFLVCLGDAAEAAGFGLAQTLRQAGLAVGFALGGRSAKAQMKAADRSGAATAVVIGDDELAAGTVQVRDLEAGEQRAVPLDALAAVLTREPGSSAVRG